MLLEWTGLTGQHATCSTGGAGETHHSKAARGHKDLQTSKVRNPSEASMLVFIKVIVCTEYTHTKKHVNLSPFTPLSPADEAADFYE